MTQIRSVLLPTVMAVAALAGVVAGGVAAPDASGAGASAWPASAAVSEVPLAEVEGRLLVPVWIEGLGEQLFMLDTAAGASVISARLRERLDPGPGEVRADSVRGASGVRVMERVRLPRLRVGPAERAGLWAVVADIGDFREYDGRAVEGILGVDALAGYDVEIDLPGGALRLVAPDGNGGGVSRVPGVPFTSRIQAGFVEFEATLGGETVRAVLDSGARQSVLNWAAAALAGLAPGSAGVRARAEGSRGIDGSARVASHLAVVDGLAIGDRRLPAAEMKIADLGIFDLIGLGDGPAMLVGIDVLRACPVMIAYSTRRLHVCPEPGSRP